MARDVSRASYVIFSSWYCHLAVFPCFLSLCTYGRSKIKLYRKEKSYCIKWNCQMAVLSLPRRYPSLNCLFNNLKKSSICRTSTIPVSSNCQMENGHFSYGILCQTVSAFFCNSVFYLVISMDITGEMKF